MLPETKDDERCLKNSVNISRWKRGTYKLNKEPVGFKNDGLLIGVDPDTYTSQKNMSQKRNQLHTIM